MHVKIRVMLKEDGTSTALVNTVRNGKALRYAENIDVGEPVMAKVREMVARASAAPETAPDSA